MKNDVLLSFIVPVYNAEKTLQETVNSVLCQIDEQLEVILIDDGSTDRSAAICDELQKRDGRVCVIHQKNAGVSAARNAGMAAAKGKWITFLDSDDLMAQQAMERLRPQLESDADTICFSWNTFALSDGSDRSNDGLTPSVHVCTPDEVKELQRNSINVQKRFQETPLHFKNSHSVWAACYRTNIIQNNHLCFEPSIKMSEDTIFRIAYWAHCSTAICMGDVLYYYRTMGESLINRYAPNVQHEILAFDQILKDTLAAHYPNSEEYNVLYYNAAIVQTHWILPMNLMHEKCPLGEKEKIAVFDAFRKQPLNQEAIEKADAHLMYPPFDKLLAALRVKDAKACYTQCEALFSSMQEKERTALRIKYYLKKMGLLSLARKIRRLLHRA